jgi:hypothetical protein
VTRASALHWKCTRKKENLVTEAYLATDHKRHIGFRDEKMCFSDAKILLPNFEGQAKSSFLVVLGTEPRALCKLGKGFP